MIVSALSPFSSLGRTLTQTCQGGAGLAVGEKFKNQMVQLET